MNYLLDTHLLLWIASDPDRLSPEVITLLANENNKLYFSAASLWEIVIKNKLGRDGFRVDANLLRTGLLRADYNEININSRHVLAVESLPASHKDPFDHILIAQAIVENITLLTTDKTVARYPGPIRLVKRR
jgi:PIN domain nuclease of toxin-antitoxin system